MGLLRTRSAPRTSDLLRTHRASSKITALWQVPTASPAAEAETRGCMMAAHKAPLQKGAGRQTPRVACVASRRILYLAWGHPLCPGLKGRHSPEGSAASY